MFFGLNIYAQQVVSLVGVIMIVIALTYLNTVVRKIRWFHLTVNERVKFLPISDVWNEYLRRQGLPEDCGKK